VKVVGTVLAAAQDVGANDNGSKCNTRREDQNPPTSFVQRVRSHDEHCCNKYLGHNGKVLMIGLKCPTGLHFMRVVITCCPKVPHNDRDGISNHRHISVEVEENGGPRHAGAPVRTDLIMGGKTVIVEQDCQRNQSEGGIEIPLSLELGGAEGGTHTNLAGLQATGLTGPP